MRYLFKHILMRDVVYNMQLGRQLRHWHHKAAKVIETLRAEDLASHYGDLAHHYRQAGQREQERHYAKLAGEQAAAKFANAEAVAYFSRAIALTPETDLTTCCELLLAREKVYSLLGRREAQQQDLAHLQSLVEALGPEQRTKVALRQAYYAEAVGDYSAAIEFARSAIDLARSTQSATDKATGYLCWGQTLWRQGNCKAARPRLERALALAQAGEHAHLEASCLRGLGSVLKGLSDYAGARAYYDRALRISREIDDRLCESATLNDLGIICDFEGDYAQAKEFFEQALRLDREIGSRRGEGLVLNNLGLVFDFVGEYHRAKICYQQALPICLEIDDRFNESLVRGNLGVIYDYLGHYDQARRHYERALQICRDMGNRQGEGQVLVYLGLLLHHQGQDEAARACSQEALSIAEMLEDRPNQGYALTHLGHALVELGDWQGAADAYRSALTVRRELQDENLAIETLAGLARVALGRAQLAQAHVEEILTYLQSNPALQGTFEPLRVYLTCYQVLRANADPRTAGLLATAYEQLQNRAARIPDDGEGSRRSFLHQVAVHRMIVNAWRAEFGPAGASPKPVS